MDEKTLAVYDDRAWEICRLYERAEPKAMRALMREHFVPGGATLDVGSGSGRETAWLKARGYAAQGVDASQGMVESAVMLHPECLFAVAALPGLSGIAPESFDNVLASAVLMHLPKDEIAPALETLLRVLRPGGRLVASFRAARTQGEREADGRLFTPLSLTEVAGLAASLGAEVLFQDRQADQWREDVVWNRIVIRKGRACRD
jgi:SAM-dependent methyltransferase